MLKSTDSSVIEKMDEEQATRGWQEKFIKHLTTGKGDMPVSKLAQFTMVGKQLYCRGHQS